MSAPDVWGRGRWRIEGRHALGVLGAAITFIGIGGFLFIWLPFRLRAPIAPVYADMAGLVLPPAAAFAAVWLVGVRAFGLDWAAFGFAPTRPRAFLQALLVWVACLPLLAAVLYAIREITGTTPIAEQKELLPPGALDDPSLSAILALFIVAAAPLGEELLFRGVLFGWLRRRLAFWPSAILSAVAFGAIHVVPVVILPVIILGLVFAWIYERTGSLWPAVAIHAFHNALVFAAVKVAEAEGVSLAAPF